MGWIWRQDYMTLLSIVGYSCNSVWWLCVRILHTSTLILVLADANQSWALQQYVALSKPSYLIWCASKPWEPSLWIIPSGRVINFYQETYHYMQWHWYLSFSWVSQEKMLDLCTLNQFRRTEDDSPMRRDWCCLNSGWIKHIFKAHSEVLFVPSTSVWNASIINIFFIY